MLASILSGITDSRRSRAIALLWLLVVTILNVQMSAAFRATILFAIPVAIVSWTSLPGGLLFAALAVVAATYGGAIPEPGSGSPLLLDMTVSFAKLCMDAVVMNAWGRRRARSRQASGGLDDAPPSGTH